MGDENYGIELKTVDKVAKNIKSLIMQNVEWIEQMQIIWECWQLL